MIRTNPRVRSLCLTFWLFALITVAQVVGALAANSLTLLSDAASMGVDSLSYLGNIYAESKVDEVHVLRNRLMSSGISLLVLFIITTVVMGQAISRLASPHQTSYGSTDALIIFIFGAVGLLFDVIALLYYYYYGSTDGSESSRSVSTSTTSADMDKRPQPKSHADLEDIEPTASKEEAKETTALNMKSAMLHVGSDVLRSLTAIFCAIVIWTSPTWDPTAVDAWSSLIVSLLIYAGVLSTAVVWVRSVRSFQEANGVEHSSLLCGSSNSETDQPESDQPTTSSTTTIHADV